MEKDSNNQISAPAKQEQGLSTPISFFADDSQFVFVFKKSERLVSALYLITGFFPDNEPLKWKLRELGSRLLSVSMSLKDGVSSKRDKAIIDIRSIILEVTSLFTVAKQSGMVSEMNFTILNREFLGLLEAVKFSEDSFQDNSSTLQDDFFKVEKLKVFAPVQRQTEAPKEEVREPDNTQDEVKDTTESVPEDYPTTGLLDASYADHHTRALESLKGQNQTTQPRSVENKPEPSKGLREFGAVAVKKNSRQSIIINLLKRKKEIMIKDVTPLIEGCSEKTIQRELLSMVEMGILKKIGEKRWSRYSLLKP